MYHVVLLGDSILDNGVYVPQREAVIDHLQELKPQGWKTTLLAVDGSTTHDVARQLAQLPKDATHLVVSVGGNDALGYEGFLNQRATSVTEVISELADIADEFQRHYEQMLAAVLQRNLPTVICTIYYPNFPDAMVQRLTVTASVIFNDVILRAAFVAGLPVMDLRLICNEASDYANPIEPSSAGGRKIARSIVNVLTCHDFTRRRSEIFC